jgi:thiamine pyrophosphate-dependent acetolactate synthase large subunit-like protein
MNLGALVTVGAAAPRNLVHFVVENGTYEANGSHPIPGRDRVDFAGLAKAAGYRDTRTFSDLAGFEAGVAQFLAQSGPVFASLKVEPGPEPVFDYGHMHGPAVRHAFHAALRAEPA